MLRTERMPTNQVFASTRLVSIVNPLEPDTIKSIMQAYQKKTDCFYDLVEFVLFIPRTGLDIFANKAFADFLDPAKKEEVLAQKYLGTLSFPLGGFSEAEIHCHLYYLDADGVALSQMRVKDTKLEDEVSYMMNKLSRFNQEDGSFEEKPVETLGNNSIEHVTV